MLFDFFIFGVSGIGLEIIFTSLVDYPKFRNNHLMGYSSFWYFPLYGMAAIILHYGHPFVFSLPPAYRGAVYIVVFWAGEYLGMGLLRLLLGKSPSEESYYKSHWNIHGLTRLDFAPAHLALGLIFEWMFRRLHSL